MCQDIEPTKSSSEDALVWMEPENDEASAFRERHSVTFNDKCITTPSPWLYLGLNFCSKKAGKYREFSRIYREIHSFSEPKWPPPPDRLQYYTHPPTWASSALRSRSDNKSVRRVFKSFWVRNCWNWGLYRLAKDWISQYICEGSIIKL